MVANKILKTPNRFFSPPISSFNLNRINHRHLKRRIKVGTVTHQKSFEKHECIARTDSVVTNPQRLDWNCKSSARTVRKKPFVYAQAHNFKRNIQTKKSRVKDGHKKFESK